MQSPRYAIFPESPVLPSQVTVGEPGILHVIPCLQAL